MEALNKISKKYSSLQHNEQNFYIGGGLSSDKFASNRHEDARNDSGKLTIGKSCQLFRKATKCSLQEVKEVINYAYPLETLEWHHAGKLPKAYGGGMKKTYFLNAEQIEYLANHWHDLRSGADEYKKQQEAQADQAERKEKERNKFLKKWAKLITRVEEPPKWFAETNREMQGKYGWFSSYGKSYNLPEYYTGYQFRSKKKYVEYLENF